MEFEKLPLKDAYMIKLKPFKDDRGGFTRLFCKKEFSHILGEEEIVQINYSITKKKGAIRGMHFQLPPCSEDKIIKCISGKVFDVIVDLRRNSPTFLRWFGQTLIKEDNNLMFVPKGFAHGFQVLEENSDLLYFHTQFYDKEMEEGIRYNDPLIGVKWPLPVSEISEKDNNYPYLTKEYGGINCEM
jgi:dTDP-4-dehydrorhamnose 3,5-epimerase